MVLCGISKEMIVDPYYFEDEIVNEENYRNIQIHYAFFSLQKMAAYFTWIVFLRIIPIVLEDTWAIEGLTIGSGE